jgi:CubicO group peptidase (beta-lactamase class C family)
MKLTQQSLERLQSVLDEHAAKRAIPGMVGVVGCGGERHVLVAGHMSFDGTLPMRRDAIFRIASMTKPFTAVAALMLADEGKLRLDEPVDRLLPELGGLRVLRTLGSTPDDTVPMKRPITVKDLLTFRLGWGVQFDPELPIQRLVGDLPGFGMPDPTSPLTPDAYLQRLSQVPLMAQPGEQWLYTVGSNILGVLVSRAAGKPLDVVFQERIFAPLGLADTGFWMPREKISRMVTGYMLNEGKWELFDVPDGRYAKPPAFPAGDSGLVSTADDFATFADFLFTGCTRDGRRLISESLLTEMKTNHLTPDQMTGGEMILGPGWGWGYGVGVQVGESPYGIPRGAYGWNGGFGTSWFNEPGSQMCVVLLTQRVFDSPDPPQVHKEFWRAACTALASTF